MKYIEKQNYFQTWIFLGLFVIAGIFVWAFIQQIILGIPFGNNPLNDELLIAFVSIPLVIVLTFLFGKMETVVTQDSIKVKLKPFMLRWKVIPFSDIQSYQSTIYRPFKEFGGWGIRVNFKGSRAYNARGNKGVRLILNDGKQILIGSSKPDLLETAIHAASGIDPKRSSEEKIAS